MSPAKSHAQFMRGGNSSVDRSLPAYQKRPIFQIARDIDALGININPAAYAYLEAMRDIISIEEPYFYDTAYEVVLRFSCNATHLRAEGFRPIRQEIKDLLAKVPMDKRI